MPSLPDFKRYHAKKFENQSSIDNEAPSVASSSIAVPAAAISMPVIKKLSAFDSVESEPSIPNLSVDSSNGDWTEDKERQVHKLMDLSSRRQHKLPDQRQSHIEIQRNKDEMDQNMPENIKVGVYHRRNKHDPAGQTAATLKQYHNNAIRLYIDSPSAAFEPHSWLSCNEIPTTNEILDLTEEWQKVDPEDNAVIMRGNQLIGRWESKDAYLSAHHEMLREDVTKPLREAVRWVQKFPAEAENLEFSGNIGIYNKVHITSITFSDRGMGFKVAFSLSKVGKNVLWEQSKRLLTGSIVALSPSSDMFRTKCIIAVIAARPLDQLIQNPPQIDLFFANPDDMEIDPVTEYTMVEERSSFFEADRHTMKALQKMMSEPFPLAEHLIDVKTNVDPPDYVLRNPFINLSLAFPSKMEGQYENVDMINDWPKNLETSMDKSQERALRQMLIKKVAIVQGPSGTGKTHVSVLALKVMLCNMALGDSPIIVACQTNHALDQLLLHVAAFEHKFARLGGRSKDRDVIKRRTMYNLRKGKKLQIPGGLRHPAKVHLDKLKSQMTDALIPLQVGKGLLDHTLLFKLELLSAAQCESLTKGDSTWSGARIFSGDEPPLKQWMGNQLLINKRTFETDSFGYEFEEADLEFEQLKELEAENCAQDDDDDWESLRGHAVSLWDAFVGKTSSNVSDDDVRGWLTKQDLYKIPTRIRGAIYNYLQRQAKDHIRAYIREQAKLYNDAVSKFRAGGWERDAVLLRQMGIKLVGLTTTGLSKYRALISALSPKVVIIEEAAETMEAPVISSCVPSLQHLILIGDHKQLRPQCAVKDLQRPPFSLNISLFERLVTNKVEYTMLKRQRRMIPEIRRLLKPIYGKEIVDHHTMSDSTIQPAVPGLGGCNSFFYSHSWPDGVDEQMSAMNSMEADMVIGFFNYLVHNGMTESEITVLTFYNGQRKLLLKKLRQHPQLGRGRIYKVVTVDSYQGEENDITILSLVRSNDMGKIGFLDMANRVCVALSRAKRGFFMFGNAELLCKDSKLWGKVVTIMAGKTKDNPATGPKCRVVFRIPLRCANHGRKTWMETPDDWEPLHGGCQKKCEHKLDCGHNCQLTCHPFDHRFVACGKNCPKALPCGHNCAELCGDTCVCTKCEITYSGRAGSLTIISDFQKVSSVENWKGYARGGHQQHDADLKEKLREMDRLAEQEPYGLRDKFLSQQAERIGTPTLRKASAPRMPVPGMISSKTSLPPPAQSSSLSVSPPSFNKQLNSTPTIALNGDRAQFAYDSRTFGALTGNLGSTGPKPFISKTNGQRPLAASTFPTGFPHPSHPQHPAPPQRSRLQRTTSRGLENPINKITGRKSPTHTPSKYQVVQNVESDLLIDLS